MREASRRWISRASSTSRSTACLMASGKRAVASSRLLASIWHCTGTGPAADMSVVWPVKIASRLSSGEPSGLMGISLRIEATLRSVKISSR